MKHLFVLKPKSSKGEYLLTTDIPNVPPAISFHTQVNRSAYTCPARLISDDLSAIETFVESLNQQLGSDIEAIRFIGSGIVATKGILYEFLEMAEHNEVFIIADRGHSTLEFLSSNNFVGMFLFQCKYPDIEFKVFQEYA
jgi:hypothetical protein